MTWIQGGNKILYTVCEKTCWKKNKMMGNNRANGIRPWGFEINCASSGPDLVAGFTVSDVETCRSTIGDLRCKRVIDVGNNLLEMPRNTSHIVDTNTR